MVPAGAGSRFFAARLGIAAGLSQFVPRHGRASADAGPA